MFFNKKPNVKVYVQYPDGGKSHQLTKPNPMPKGISYQFINKYGDNDIVEVPKDYTYASSQGSRWVGKIYGCSSACPLVYGFHLGLPIDPNCPGQSLAVLISSDIHSRAGKTLRGKQPFPWIWVIAIVGILIVAYFGIKSFAPKAQPANNQNIMTTSVKK